MNQIPEIEFAPGFESSLNDAVSRFGVVKVTGTLTNEQLKRLNSEYEKIIESEQPGVRDMGVEGGVARDVTPADFSKGEFSETVQYFHQPWMAKISDLYWGERRTLNDHIFVTREIKGTKHLAQDLHFDVQETLKFFLYLNDVTAENGAFSCVPGSMFFTKEKRNQLGDKISYDDRGSSREHPFDESEILPVEATAGTLIVFTTEVWHRAGMVSSGERRVMRGHTRTEIKTPESGDLSMSKPSFVRRVKSLLRFS